MSTLSSVPVRRGLRWVGAAGLLCVLTAGPPTHRGSRAEERPVPPTEAPAPVVSLEGARRAFLPGGFHRYTLSSSQSFSIRAKQPDAQLPPPMRFQLEGNLRVGVSAEGPESVDARLSLSLSALSVDVGGNGPLAPEDHRRLLEALSTPFFVTLDRAGAVRLIHFEHTVDVLVQGLLRVVVAASQVVLPSPGSDVWETNEEDSTGRYLARYRREYPLQINKSKLRYTHLAIDTGPGAEPGSAGQRPVVGEGLQPVGGGIAVEVDTRATITLAPEDLWLASLTSEEKLTVEAGLDMAIPSSHARVELRLVERGTDPSVVGSFAARKTSLFSLPLASPQLARPEDPREPHRRALAGRSLKDFVRILRALPKETRDKGDRSEKDKAREDAWRDAAQGLHALFVLEPAAALGMPDLVRHKSPGSDVPSLILGALSAATTRESLHALVEIMADTRLALEVRRDAVESLNAAEAPTEESVSALWKLSRGRDAELRSSVVYALGSVAGHLLQSGDAPAANALVEDLCQALSAARGGKAQTMWIGALGNTRSPRALPSLQAFVTDPSTEVRSAATTGLRFMPAPEAERLLSERLLSDDEPQVRNAAVFAAGFRPLDLLLPAVERALHTDSMASVRIALVQLLGGHAAASPEARRVLLWSRREDPDASVRHAAETALGGPPPPGSAPATASRPL